MPLPLQESESGYFQACPFEMRSSIHRIASGPDETSRPSTRSPDIASPSTMRRSAAGRFPVNCTSMCRWQ